MITEILKIDPINPQLEHIIKAAEILKKGGVVAFPTETVYGLAVDFFNKDAVKKLYEIKKRSFDKPFTVHIADLESMERLKCEVSSFGRALIEQFWPGPLTLIFSTSNLGKIGIRMPNNKVALELIKQSNTLIAAPSANISGNKAPKDAKGVEIQLKDKIDLILDAGETQLSKESTILDMTISPYRLLRIGALAKDVISDAEFVFWKNKVAPTIKKILFVCTGNSCRSAMAEGYLKKRLLQVEREDIEVISRGIGQYLLPKATKETLEVLRAEGIDMKAHKPMPLTDKEIETADLIFAMEAFHKDEILERAPSKRERVYLLAEFGLWGGRIQQVPFEIPDPIGKSPAVYKEIFTLIKNSIERLVRILI